jgi:TolA-binding protein
MKRAIIITSIVCFAFLFQGCSSITVLRTKEMNAARDTLRVRIDSLQKKILEEQQTQNEMLRLLRADQQVRFSEIEKNIGEIGSGLSESQYRLSKIDEKTANFQKQLQAKFTADSITASSRNAEIDNLFQIASSDYAAGRFDIALNGFKDLMSRFPDSPAGKDAEYWAAECLNGKKEYAEAEKVYILFYKKNPQGSLGCTVLYKLGLVYEKQNKEKSRDMVWKKLIENCPDSDEAKLLKKNHKK